jgi:CHAD domain-containing protein
MIVRLVETAHPTRQLRRAIAAEVREARHALEHAPPDVHTARRVLKRARALVRLGRAAWPADDRRRLGRPLRDAGRHAAEARDAEARIEAVDRLAWQLEPRYAEALDDLHGRLALGAPASVPGREPDAAIAAARAEVERARDLLKQSPPRGRGRGIVVFEPGLTRITERGAEALDHARTHPDEADAYHDLRKRSKDLRHALEFLEPAWPTILGVWASELHRLTDDLGEANDLTLLLAWTDRHPSTAHPGDTPPLRAAIREVQAARRSTALALAGRIWEPPPAAFARTVLSWVERPELAPQVPQ